MEAVLRISSVIKLRGSIRFLAVFVIGVAGVFSIGEVVLIALIIPSLVSSTCEAALLSFSFTTYALSGSGIPIAFALILFISQ